MTTPKIRVALLSQHFAEYACLLAKGLAESCEVLLILNEENARNELGVDWQKRFQLPSLRLVPLPKARSAGMIWSNYLGAKRAVRDFGPDVIHCQEGGIWDELIPLLLAWKTRPLVLTVHDPVPHSGADSKRLAFSRHRIYHTLLRKLCDVVIVHGDALADLLSESDSRLKQRVFAVPHGVLGPENRALNTDWAKGNVLFFGRIHEYKGLGDFIIAVRLLAERGVPVRAVIAGRGPDLDRYRNDISGSPLFDIRDRFIPTDEVHQLFDNANVVVMPYTDGTQSGVAAMALGYGRPMVATRVGAIPEMVRDHVNGLLVAPRSPAELADAMETLIVDQPFAQRLAKNSRELGRGALSWREIAARTVAVYRRAGAGQHGIALQEAGSGPVSAANDVAANK